MKSLFSGFPFAVFRDFMKRAGINSGYQAKPCLEPGSTDCPLTAPNRGAAAGPDVGAELTGGCYGFATRYMHWPEQLIVGGVSKNKSGHIRGAGGLQSMVQLMGVRDMFDYWSNTYKVHTINWSHDKARQILQKFQQKFEESIRRSEESSGQRWQFHSYSSLGLQNIVSTFSALSPVSICLGCLLMASYALCTLYRWSDRVRSQAGLGLAGVLLVIITVAAGLGLASLVGLTFNAASTQIVPFLALGLGVDSVFLLIHTFSIQTRLDIPYQDQVGEVLRKCGVSVLTTAVCNVAAFLSAALIPIPALRSFCMQAALLTGLNTFSLLLLFPAMMALDTRRVFAGRLDLLFCLAPNKRDQLQETKQQNQANSDTERCYSSAAQPCSQWSLTALVSRYYGTWVAGTAGRAASLGLTAALLVAAVYGAGQLQDGLDLTDVVPRNTSVWRFLQAQDQYFGFYDMYAITQDNFEYPQNQAVLYEYHDSFVRVKNIIKDDDGGLPEFWLSLFRTWLTKLQTAYDADTEAGLMDVEGWQKGATDDAILAYKLLVQTGHVDYPVDKSLLGRARLVSETGIINPAAFYNYLSAWYTNDAMAYSYSRASLEPTPKEWFHDPRDYDLKIPKSKPIKFAQIPFLLNNLGDTHAMVETIGEVREICDRFQQRGLPNFPNGIPFTFWEQYIGLRWWLLLALAAALAAVFTVVSLLLCSPWAGGLTVLVLSCITGQLFGALGLLGIKLSAVPAVILILAVGVGVEFTVHILMSFVGSVGTREQRMVLALEHMFAPVLHGACSTLLGVLMLAFSQFDFIVRYFFLVLLVLLVLGLFNGLVLLPVLLVMVGPPAQVSPADSALSSLPPATPQPSPPRFKVKPVKPRSSGRSSAAPHTTTSHKPRRHNSDISLSTIAEESHASADSRSLASCSEESQQDQQDFVHSSYNGTSVFLEPHITVETETLPANTGGGQAGGRCSSPAAGGGQVTKVTATAKFKLELHTGGEGLGGAGSRPGSRRSRRSSAGSAAPSSGENSLASSLSSDGGFSEK